MNNAGYTLYNAQKILLVQWVDRDATGGAPIALLLQWVERDEPS